MAHTYQTTLTVLPDWIDHNGHMNVAYYVVAFDMATDEVYDDWGLGFDYPERSGHSVYTLGMNVDYLRELVEGEPIRITTRLLDFDHKRVHYIHQMYSERTGKLSATNECLAMNIDLELKRSTPFSAEIQQKLANVHNTHKLLPQPTQIGRKLAIRR